MCGIIGYAGQNLSINKEYFEQIRNTMHHRGPDDSGSWISKDKTVILGHQRLSIIDLSPLGHQPMLDDKHGLSIVFNGEIYNHIELRKTLKEKGYSFRSHSDTEVLLAAYATWGKNCLSYLNGMFAFAIYDASSQQVFIARDRAGEKPLFYFNTDNQFGFASELKAILANKTVQRKIDKTSFDCYLKLGYIPRQHCIIKGVRKLPAAHALIYDINNNKLKTWRYWQLPQYTADNTLDEVQLLDELESLLNDSVKHQLIADVPIGILLSGGIDSSIITALAARHTNHIQTFNIRFPGHGKYDETQHARLIANYFDTDHIEFEAQEATADILPILAKQYDEPIADSSMIPTYLVSQLVRKHCTVALGGDGGDELFGGYTHYCRYLKMNKYLKWFPIQLRQLISYGASHIFPVGFKGRNFLQSVSTNFDETPNISPYFDYYTRKKILPFDIKTIKSAESVYTELPPTANSFLNRMTDIDFNNYLSDDILVKVDRASMLNSLELRAPFLDYRLIEFAFSKIPPHLKATPSSKKILLKKLTNKLLPPEFDNQRKQGFSIPLANWLQQGAFRELFYDTLLSSDCIFDKKVIQSLLKGQDEGKSNSERLFALVFFELWRKEYSITL